jgi:hypothetical protein
MTSGRALLLVTGIAIGYLAFIAIQQMRLVPATPENESSFLKSYTPSTVIDRFKIGGISEDSGASDGANFGFAVHEREFGPTITIHAKDWVALMQALHDDVAERLAAQGAQILSETGSATDGFTIQYAVGKTRGVIALEPLKGETGNLVANAAPGSDQVTVSFRIHIDEKWTKSGTPTAPVTRASK